MANPLQVIPRFLLSIFDTDLAICTYMIVAGSPAFVDARYRRLAVHLEDSFDEAGG